MARRSWSQGWAARFRTWLGALALRPVPVGRPGDGLLPLRGGTELDKPWGILQQELSDTLELWRTHPLARRMVGLVTAYVVGPGIELRSHYPPLARFVGRFAAHPQNTLALRQYQLCDELSRAGELFVVLHTNPADGMSYLRTLPASSIDRVEWRPGDYEAETRYHERVALDDPDYPEGRWWRAAGAGDEPQADRPAPVVLHFAVNRPVGCVRGESDLAAIRVWLLRYRSWLEDRVRLNAAVRAFLWVVKVPGALVAQKRAEYARPPEAGSVLVIDKASEEWEAVAPRLSANDAAADGRAIRWMVVAGGPGVGLVDMGEAETSNLATAQAMGEQRWRFMRQRQTYFGYILAQIAVTAYNRCMALGKLRGRPVDLSDVEVGLPDIAVADNATLGSGAASVAAALEALQRLGLQGEHFQRMAARLVLGFAGETVSERDLEALMAGSEPARESDGARDGGAATDRPGARGGSGDE